MRSTLSLIFTRILMVGVVMWGAATIVFGSLRLSGDPVLLFVAPDTPPETIARIRHELGFDAPLPVQYVLYLQDLLTGNLGVSLRYRQPVADLILHRLPLTIELSLAGLVFAVVIGIPAGIIAALKRGTVFDQISMGISLIGQSVPPFWLGLMLILWLAVRVELFPTSGDGTIEHLILPAITVGSFSMARIARITRTSILEILSQDYLRTARGKGLTEFLVFVRHTAPNAAIPILTVMSVTYSTLLGGSIVTETVFNWPGVGMLMYQGVLVRDYPLVQGGVLVIALLVAIVSVMTDLAYVMIDPRIHFGNR